MVRRCLVLTAVVACGPVKGTPPGGDAPSGDPGFEIAALTTNPNVPVDGRAGIELSITRTGGFDGEIAIAAVTPPNGLEIDPLVIAAGESTAELAIGATTPLAIGDTVSFTVEATAGELPAKQLDFEDADVTGKPGSLDITWGDAGTGFGQITMGGDDGRFDAMEVLAGKVIATGFALPSSASSIATARFTAAGLIDTTFTDGAENLVRVNYAAGSGESSRASAIGHQLDGRPILIGQTSGNVNGTAVNGVSIVRLSATGGNGGQEFGNQSGAKSRLDLDTAVGARETISDGVVLADNKIVFVGTVSGKQIVGRATSNGNLDDSFATTGFVLETIGTTAAGKNVAVDTMGRLIVLGTTSSAADITDLTVSRYKANGDLDAFGAPGGRTTLAANTDLGAIGMVLLSSGKIVVAATSPATGGTHYTLFRLNADGSVDDTFGTDGVADVVAPGAAVDMTVLPDGKLLFAGQDGDNLVLVRFKASGAIDALFGTAGVVSVPFGEGTQIGCVEAYDADRIVIGGSNGGPTPGPGITGLVVRIWD
jgi:uncharacterized delta-60 repeat protein